MTRCTLIMSLRRSLKTPLADHYRAVADSKLAGRARRTGGQTDEMKEITRHMTVMKWMMVLMIGLELATLVMLPVHQPADQTIPDAR